MTDGEVRNFTPMVLESSRKKPRVEEAGWKKIHEQYFSNVLGLVWPPNVDFLPDGLSVREAECVLASSKTFPAEEVGWQWMDANHTLERNLRYEVNASIKKTDSEDLAMTSPWSRSIPTITCKSSIVGRHMDKNGQMTWKLLNVLEGFQAHGWGLGDWSVLPFQSGQIQYEELQVMLGNMWDLHHYMPVALSTMWILGEVEFKKPGLDDDAEQDPQQIVVSDDESDGESDDV
jgi:hypothetical protein